MFLQKLGYYLPYWLLLFISFPSLFAQDIAFPSKATVVNVTRAPYNAKGDGITDDTQAIQSALNNYPDGEFIIYLPNGTYLISEQLEWPKVILEESSQRKVIMQGQNRENTILKLAASSPNFQDANNPKAILRTGEGLPDRFRNAIRNLTVETGTNNPGVIGIQFMANKQGTLQNVIVRNPSNDGLIGVDFSYNDEIGPLLVKNVRIEGFNTGIKAAYELNSMTFEHIELVNQNEYGIFNEGQILNIRGLTTQGSVPAIVNQDASGVITLIDAQIQGEGQAITQTAINNQGTLFARNLSVNGYNRSIDNQNGTPQIILEKEIPEFISHEILKLCPTPDKSLNLPIEETPEVAWGNPEADWVSIGDFGALSGDTEDDSQAIQQAIDSGASTVFIPPVGPYPFAFYMTDTVYVRGNVQRIIGTEGRIFGPGIFKIEDGTAPTVVIERMDRLAGGILHTSNRDLVLKQLGIKSYRGEAGSGNVFIEDVQGGPWLFSKQNVWARQLTTEVTGGSKITNNGGQLWILGLSTQRGSTVIETINGGETEVLGGHIYTTSITENEPMFLNNSSSISLAGIRESSLYGATYQTLIQEIRGEVNRNITPEEAYQSSTIGSLLPLYVGYIPTSNQFNEPPTADAGEDLTTDIIHPLTLKADADDDGFPNTFCIMDVEWSVLEGGIENVVFDNVRALQPTVYFKCAGTYVLQLEARDGEFSAIDQLQVTVYDRVISTTDHDGDNINSGNGGDASIQTSSAVGNGENFGGSALLGVQNFINNRQKAYIRFDKSQIPNTIEQAIFSLQIANEDMENPSDFTFNVFGMNELTDYGIGHLGEDWGEGTAEGTIGNPDELNWDNAPANNTSAGGAYNEGINNGGGVDNNQTTFLGTFSLADAERGIIQFETPALVDFLNADNNGLATLIITQVEISNTPTFFASKEHPDLLPPTLSLSYNGNCSDTFLPIAKFSSNYDIACEGSSIQFTDESAFFPTEWNWTFEGGIPTNSNEQNPSIRFDVAGIYTVRLEVHNDNGSNVFEQVVEIIETEGNVLPFSENFEEGTGVWNIDNPDADEALWSTVIDDNCNGRALGLDNFTDDTRNTSDVFSANFDLSGYRNSFLQFDVAYTPYNDQFFDQLRVVAQTCEGEEYIVFDKGGFVLATTSLNEQFFLPINCDEWRMESVDLSAFDDQVITLKFINYGGYGNYLLVDNILVDGDEIVGIEDFANSDSKIWLNAYPNPNNGQFSLQLSSPSNTPIQLSVSDMSGKIQYTTQVNYLQSRTIHTENLHLNHLSAGLYLLQLEQNGQKTHQKLLIN